MAKQAIQSFSAEFEDGSPAQAVQKGDVFSDGHPLVRRDTGPDGELLGNLFKHLDLGDDAARPRRGKA